MEQTQQIATGLSVGDTITLIGIILTFIVSSCSLFQELKANKMNRYSHVISRIRSDWIRDLRLETADFVQNAINCINNVGDWKQTYAALQRNSFVIKTHLGKSFNEYKKAVDDIIAFVERCHCRAVDLSMEKEKFDVLLGRLSECSEARYISQWKAIKHEATEKK